MAKKRIKKTDHPDDFNEEKNLTDEPTHEPDYEGGREAYWDGESSKKEKEPVIHIIVRTHQRPGYFRRCIESIKRQNYGPKVVHVIADDTESEAYALSAMNEGLADEVRRVYSAQYSNKFGDFAQLKRDGFCRSDRDNRRHHYDLYLNDVVDSIDDGWIFFVDDDKEVPDGVLERISEEIKSQNVIGDDLLIIGQYQMKNRLVPSGENWGKPFIRGHVDMSCFIFHVKNKQYARLDGHGAGDFRAACRLYEHIGQVVWIETPFTTADNDGNFGKPEKR